MNYSWPVLDDIIAHGVRISVRHTEQVIFSNFDKSFAVFGAATVAFKFNGDMPATTTEALSNDHGGTRSLKTHHSDLAGIAVDWSYGRCCWQSSYMQRGSRSETRTNCAQADA